MEKTIFQEDISKKSKIWALLLASVLSSCAPKISHSPQIDQEKFLQLSLKNAESFDQILEILKKNWFSIPQESLIDNCEKYNHWNKFFTIDQWQFFSQHPKLVQCGNMIAKSWIFFVSQTKFWDIFPNQKEVRLNTWIGQIQFFPDDFGTRIFITQKY